MSNQSLNDPFDPALLWPVETILLAKAAHGEWNICETGGGEPPELRAAFIRHLIMQLPVPHLDGSAWSIQSSGVQLCNARIIGQLNLKDGRSPHGGALPNLELENCTFEAPVWLDFGHFQRLSLKGSRMSDLWAAQVRVDGDVDLSYAEVLNTDRAFERAAVDLRGSRIDGRLDMVYARINTALNDNVPVRGRSNWAVALDEAVVCGLIDAGNLKTYGLFSLHDALLKASVWFDSAKFDPYEAAENDVHIVINAQRAHLGGLLCLEDFHTDGVVSLLGTTIDGALDIVDSYVGMGLNAPEVTVGGRVWFKGVRFGNGINLGNARMGGEVELQDCTVTEAVQREKRIEHGMLKLSGAKIAGDLKITGAFFPGFEINLYTCSIGGDLSAYIGLGEEKTKGLKGITLDANDMRVAGSAWIAVPSHSHVVAWCANVGIDFSPESDNSRTIRWTLNNATFGCLIGEDGKGWGEKPVIEAIDLKYTDFRVNSGAVNVSWLKHLTNRQAPQPYLQLAKVLASAGHRETAHSVLSMKNWAEIRYAAAEPFARTKWYFWPMAALTFLVTAPFRVCIPALFGIFFRFGLSPLRAALTLLVLVASGWLLSDLALKHDLLALSSQPVAAQVAKGADGLIVGMTADAAVISLPVPCRDAVSPLWYAVDTMVPLLDLKQASQCKPEIEGTYALPTVFGVSLPAVDTRAMVWIQSIYALLGALVTSLTILTFSGVLKGSLKE